MAKSLSDQQRRLLDYLRIRYEAADVLPEKRQICKELGCSDGELAAAIRALTSQNYIKDVLDVTGDFPYQVLRDGEGNPLATRPRYLPLGRTWSHKSLHHPESADPGNSRPRSGECCGSSTHSSARMDILRRWQTSTLVR